MNEKQTQSCKMMPITTADNRYQVCHCTSYTSPLSCHSVNNAHLADT